MQIYTYKSNWIAVWNSIKCDKISQFWRNYHHYFSSAGSWNYRLILQLNKVETIAVVLNK